jgi:2-C-methyl-D-erythritol 2,4-cyclodiphosphate synthase
MPNPPIRIGFGYDVHRYAPGRRLVLGGVQIAAPLGLLGHSDADVLTHAVMDALLGAAALGDIGHYFPPADARWKDADSIALLERVAALLAEHGWRVGNVDASIVMERPKLAPHLPAMRARLAAALGVADSQVSVKATTNEGMGFVGREEGAAAYAVALIARTDDAAPAQ